MNAADDFPEIAKRWKEIREQTVRRIAGSPPEPAATTPTTVTGSGGFITPDGKPYNAIPHDYIG